LILKIILPIGVNLIYYISIYTIYHANSTEYDNAIVCAPKTELKYKSRLRQHFEQNIIFHI